MAQFVASQIYGRKASTDTNWITVIAMTAFHVGAVAAFFFVDWGAILAAIILWYVCGSWGIGMAYHRLLTHRGYKTTKWMEYFLTLCGTLALEGGPIFWVATHHDTQVLRRYVPDLAKDPFHVALTTWHWVPQVIVGLGLLAFGGIPYVLWGIFFRTTFLLHCTWLVNSATHIWGSRRFRTRDDSTNLWWVALLSWGEGWHNNHHAHPVSARHGLAWYELDVNWVGIKLLEKLGLAWDIKVAKVNQDLEEEAA
jgi:sn-1 stearoyl-lipid 9-desaturase